MGNRSHLEINGFASDYMGRLWPEHQKDPLFNTVAISHLILTGLEHCSILL